MAQEPDELPGYQRGEPVHDSSASSVYRARRVADGALVVIKRSRGNAVSARQLTRYRNEFELLGSLQCAGVVKARELVRHEGQIALVLEDIPGVSLRRWIETRDQSGHRPAARDRGAARGASRRGARRAYHSQGHYEPQRRLRSRHAPLHAHRLRHRDATALRGEQVSGARGARRYARLHRPRANGADESQPGLPRGSVLARRHALRALHGRASARQHRPPRDGALPHRGQAGYAA